MKLRVTSKLNSKTYKTWEIIPTLWLWPCSHFEFSYLQNIRNDTHIVFHDFLNLPQLSGSTVLNFEWKQYWKWIWWSRKFHNRYFSSIIRIHENSKASYKTYKIRENTIFKCVLSRGRENFNRWWVWTQEKGLGVFSIAWIVWCRWEEINFKNSTFSSIRPVFMYDGVKDHSYPLGRHLGGD